MQIEPMLIEGRIDSQQTLFLVEFLESSKSSSACRHSLLQNTLLQQSLLIGAIPDTWMVGGIALIIIALVLLVVAVRCAIHYIPRLFGYETTNRIEGPGHSLGMYSLDLQTTAKQQGYANAGYVHRESVTTA